MQHKEPPPSPPTLQDTYKETEEVQEAGAWETEPGWHHHLPAPDSAGDQPVLGHKN